MEEGYNPAYGARPLRRAIMRLLEDSMAERMLSGDIKEGDSVIIDVDADGQVPPAPNHLIYPCRILDFVASGLSEALPVSHLRPVELRVLRWHPSLIGLSVNCCLTLRQAMSMDTLSADCMEVCMLRGLWAELLGVGISARPCH